LADISLTAHFLYALTGVQQPGACMTDNVEIAILTKVNELAERHGLKASDFVAVLHVESDVPNTDLIRLSFDVPVSGNEAKEKRFAKMIGLLDTPQGALSLWGTDEEIIDSLDKAIRRSPKRHALS
jgi:hypothetical protein